MLLSKSFQDALQYLGSVRSYSAATLSNRERAGSQFIAFLRSTGQPDDVRSFNVDTVMDFGVFLGKQGCHPNTINNKLDALSSFARYLLKRKDALRFIQVDPTKAFERPAPVKVETKFLYPDELVKFMAVETSPEGALAREVFVDTGIRVAEACEANVGDLQEVDGVVYLTIAVKGRRQRHAEPASVPLSATCAEIVKSVIAARVPKPKADAPLLLDLHGRRWNRTQLSIYMARLGERAGITRVSTSPHRLRHTANVIARQAKIDAPTRAKMMNHRSQATLARYDHLVPGELAQGREQQRRGFEAYMRHGSTPQTPEGAE